MNGPDTASGPAKRTGATTRLVTSIALVTAGVMALAAAVGLRGVASASEEGPRGHGLSWRACGETSGTARCAELPVPVDWRRPGSDGRITLRVALRPADDPAKRVGVLLFNPGGPGWGAADIVANPDWARFYFPRVILDRFDVVGVDPRGVPGSTPVKCPGPARDASVTRYPTDASGVARLTASNAGFAASCAEATGALAGHLGTDSVARDLEAVRAALGEERITFLGVSYGTMIAQAYAERYPRRLRAVVLDAVVDRSLDASRLALDTVIAAQDRASRFAASCAADATCPLGGRDVLAALRALYARADGGGVSANGRAVTSEELSLVVAGALAAPAAERELAEGVRVALDSGDASALLNGAVFTDPAYGRYRSIVCQDLPRLDPASLPALAERAQRLGTGLRGASEFWDITTGCVGSVPEPSWRPHAWSAPAGIPVMILSGAHDPVTPRSWAEAVHQRISGSRILRWDGDGHGAWPMNNAAAVQAATEYLLNPSIAR